MYCSGIKSFSSELKMLERRVRNFLPSSINQAVLVHDCMGVYTGWYILASLLEDKGWDHFGWEQSSFCHFWIRFDPNDDIPPCSHKMVKFKPCSCVPVPSSQNFTQQNSYRDCNSINKINSLIHYSLVFSFLVLPIVN